MTDKKDKLIVAAIDIGITFSGYAFIFKHDYKRDPCSVPFTFNWSAGCKNDVTQKVPTCLLLNPRQEFVAFGYEAEDLYSELALNEEHYDHYFFEGFKMLLYETNSIQKLSNTTMIRDDKGKEVPALDLFAHVIRYLKNHLLSALDAKGTTINNKDIHWVLPVPAIWKISAKQFMREAANKAGILTEQLTVCLDSKAAFLYCLRVPATKLTGSTGCLSPTSFIARAKYMIINLGGKRAEINIYQIQSDGTIRELHIPTGLWGGTKINEALDRIIIEIVGSKVFEKFKDDYKYDHIDICRKFESKMRFYSSQSSDRIAISIPCSLFEVFEKETGGKTINDVIQQTQYANKMSLRLDMLRIKADLIEDFIMELHVVDPLVEHIRHLMTKDNLSDISNLLMVGEMSESSIMQSAIMKAFPDKTVIVPKGAKLALLKGAVMFGYEPFAVLESNPPGLL